MNRFENIDKEILINNTYGNLWYYPDLKMVHHEFHKYCVGEPFREFLIKGQEIITKTNCSKWLSDDRKVGLVSEEDRRWASAHWIEKTVKAGWAHWALVKPKTAIGLMSIKQQLEYYSSLGINAKIFADPTDAMIWLKEQ